MPTHPLQAPPPVTSPLQAPCADLPGAYSVLLQAVSTVLIPCGCLPGRHRLSLQALDPYKPPALTFRALTAYLYRLRPLDLCPVDAYPAPPPVTSPL